MHGVRLGLAVTGFVFAVATVVLDDLRLGWAATALLGASLLLRILSRRRQDPES
jgi:hypothetical protein